MHFTETLRRHLGWCPNHQVPASRPARINSMTYAIIIVAALGILAAAQYIPSHSSQDVAVWAFRVDDTGTRNFIARLPATEDAAGTVSFPAAGTGTSSLPAGKYWLVIEHPGKDGSYRFTLDGTWITGPSPDSPGNVIKFFKVAGPGSLQKEDAYEALMAAYNGGTYVTGSSPALGGSSGVTEREYTVTP